MTLPSLVAIRSSICFVGNIKVGARLGVGLEIFVGVIVCGVTVKVTDIFGIGVKVIIPSVRTGVIVICGGL